TQSGFGYGGTSVGNRVVRWEKRGDEILLRDVQYRIRAGETGGVAKSVAATSVMPIIQSFPVLAWGKDQAAVIDVTDVFMGDLPEFSAKRNLDASGVDSKRSYLESVKAFPENIETSVMMTYRLNSSSGAPSGGGRRGPFPGGGSRRDPTQGAVTVELHHSMVKLPARPMVPRKYDDRVGFFGVSFEEYDGQEHEVETVRYITRWRLEKKDPAAAVSDPVKPITFYVGRGVPDKWRPYVHQGIEMWKPAFEAAGFSNAIQALDPPSEREDPDWDAEDARISSIRWLPSTVENAMGPHVHDPRTGEILEADILMFHNVIKLARDWYFVQASPNDPRAQKLPLPDEIIGEALAYVVAHEVGHSLGFPHNMKASSSFTVEQLRDAEFTAKNGTEASIMDYGRFNYVAQPGDGARLIPTIGPYDYFAAEWGYREYASAEAEAEGLKALTARQKENVVLRFGDPNPGEDPSQQTEDLGSDAIEATTLGLKNIDRVASYLVEACCNEGENYDLLENMYGQLVGQRDRELMHVASVVGGFVKGNLWYGDADQVYNSVDPLRQREAIRFLQENAFHAPASLIDPAITLRLEADGAADRILRGQSRILSSLMSDDRIKRMAEHATRDGVNAYRPVEMLRDVTSGIWAELGEADVKVDLYRRNLQRTHANLLAEKLEDPEVDSDMPGLSRGELKLLLEAVSAGLSRAADEETRAHLEDMKARIRQALDPRLEFEPETDGALPAGLRR
ncbi:MAG TPA: zinc-dependent metalloprotease, partial [Planctomycetota bacterium]